MLSDRLGEIIVPMVTPFRRTDEAIELAVVEQLVEHLVANDYCDTIMAAGTTGEFSTLSFDERIELFRAVKSANSGRKTIAGIHGCSDLRQVCCAAAQQYNNNGKDTYALYGKHLGSCK